MKPLSPLSAAARAMLEAGSRVEPPSAEQSERMARTLAPLFESAGGALSPAALSPAALSPAAPSGAAPQAPRGPGGSSRLLLGGGGKLLLAAGALAASHGASFWFGRLSSHVEPAAPEVAAVAAPAVATPMLVAPMLPAPLPAPAHSEAEAAPPPASTNPTPASTRSTRRAPPAPPATGLHADIQRLSRADAQLREGRASEALRLLAPPVVRELREQAAALRAVAGCTAASRGASAVEVAAAERDARAMLERFPDSPYEARVRSACDH